MARFRYRAVTASGDLVEGETEAVTRQAVVKWLHEQGQLPIRAEEVSARSASRGPVGLLRFSRDRLPPATVTLITRQLATLLRAGLPIDRALAILDEREDEPRKRRFMKRLLESVRGGMTLSDALLQHKDSLPPYYIGLVRAGEAGGTLSTVLLRLSEVLEQSQTLRESVRSAMYYPIFVLVMSVLTLTVLLTLVVPEFRPLFEEGAKIPAAMAFVLAISDLIRHFGWALVAAIIILILALRYQFSRPAGRLFRDRCLLAMPLLGPIATKVEVARFARTFGTLLANGVVMLNALTITVGTIGNQVIAAGIGGIATRLKRGEGLAVPLMESGVVPRLAVQLVQVGEESGQLDEMLLRIADIYDEEVRRSVQRIFALLVPVLTVCLGLLVAAIVGSMLVAILSTYEIPI
jgi:general secretion pathway protein F